MLQVKETNRDLRGSSKSIFTSLLSEPSSEEELGTTYSSSLLLLLLLLLLSESSTLMGDDDAAFSPKFSFSAHKFTKIRDEMNECMHFE